MQRSPAAAPPRVADAFAAPPPVSMIFPAPAAVSRVDAPIPGSMEHFIKMTHAPLVEACGCPHGPTVDATFGDRGIVSCGECGSAWSVPFTVDDTGSVATGHPEPRLDTAGD